MLFEPVKTAPKQATLTGMPAITTGDSTKPACANHLAVRAGGQPQVAGVGRDRTAAGNRAPSIPGPAAAAGGTRDRRRRPRAAGRPARPAGSRAGPGSSWSRAPRGRANEGHGLHLWPRYSHGSEPDHPVTDRADVDRYVHLLFGTTRYRHSSGCGRGRDRLPGRRDSAGDRTGHAPGRDPRSVLRPLLRVAGADGGHRRRLLPAVFHFALPFPGVLGHEHPPLHGRRGQEHPQQHQSAS